MPFGVARSVGWSLSFWHPALRRSPGSKRSRALIKVSLSLVEL